MGPFWTENKRYCWVVGGERGRVILRIIAVLLGRGGRVALRIRTISGQ